MKKNFWASLLAARAVAGLVLSVVAVIVLIDTGALHLLGVRYTSLGGLMGYVLTAAVIGLPLELFTNGLAGALYRLDWATRRQANLFFIPLDTLCSVFAFWLTDRLMDGVEANALAITVVGLLSALASQPISKARAQKKDKTGREDGNTDL